MVRPYLDEVRDRMIALLKAVPDNELASEMNECEAAARGYLNLWPNRESRRHSAATYSAITG